MALEDVFNFVRIDDRIITGGQPTQEQLEECAAAGIAGVINLAPHDPDNFALPGESETVADLGNEETLSQLATIKGDTKRGKELFQMAGCAACHTVQQNEPLKGPYLGNIATIYRRHELAGNPGCRRKGLVGGEPGGHQIAQIIVHGRARIHARDTR